MPTYNRRPFIRHAIANFYEQDWPNKELIIGDDGTDCVSALVAGTGCSYYRLGGMALGAKRNALVRLTNGDIIAHWDDDDWYHPSRLREQYELLNRGWDLVGYNACSYWDERHAEAWQWSIPMDDAFMCGASMMYRKAAWDKAPFYDNLVRAEDNAFLANIPKRHGVDGRHRLVARVHSLSIGEMRQVLDVARYREVNTESIVEVEPELLPAEFCREVKIAA